MSTIPETCRSCLLTDKDVECSGIYFCPNPLCRSAGASWFRVQMSSYRSVDGSKFKHTVDPHEMLMFAEWLLEMPPCAYRDAILRMLPYWTEQARDPLSRQWGAIASAIYDLTKAIDGMKDNAFGLGSHERVVVMRELNARLAEYGIEVRVRPGF